MIQPQPAMKSLCYFLSLLWITSGLLSAAQPLPARQRPNFLVLFTDDQRADTLRAWGNRHIQTPNLDRLARRGTSFRGNYCFGSNSGAVCIPSRAMLMSGRTWMDIRHNLVGTKLLPELLGEKGYSTFATGKWHNENSSFSRAFQQGRSVFFGGMDDHTKMPIVDFDGAQFTPRRTAAHFSSEEFANSAIQFLQEHSSKSSTQPFFCYVAFTAPHDPRNPPESFRELYYKNPPPLPDNFLPQHPFNTGWNLHLRDENLAPYPRPQAMIRDQLCEYYGLITHLDQQIGRVLDALAKSPFAQNTYIIYASDHGLALGSHGLLGKQSVYEHSMRSPLIIAGPGVPSGKSTSAFTYLFDLFPTIADLAQVQAPSNLAGTSLRPLWTGERKAVRDSVFLPFTDSMRAIRDSRFKLIVYPQINHRQLFDLKKDPSERQNLAEDPRYTAQQQALVVQLQEWQAKTGDTQPLSVPNPKPKALITEGYECKPDAWQPKWIVEKYF